MGEREREKGERKREMDADDKEKRYVCEGGLNAGADRVSLREKRRH